MGQVKYGVVNNMPARLNTKIYLNKQQKSKAMTSHGAYYRGIYDSSVLLSSFFIAVANVASLTI